ncbi:hypothetical protein [Kineococcus indalonis]|uniref:hypothetical protein n=1 Tax=Kineococcus indalonis TaxID=2696566 RepID=UPI00141221E3|nr:hypothetical protein [Kineococcus indalonis]NAZ85656.1 hypothetical protein [Kineococcus indalonis]
MEEHRTPPADRQHLLAIYLNDHYAGATAGRARFARAARSHRGSDAGQVLARLAREVAEDKDTLLRTMRALGVEPDRRLQALGRAAEAAGALKTNGRLLRRSPLSSVVELELLHLGVLGKGAVWRALRELALTDERLDAEQLQELVHRADRQAAELEALRRSAVVEALGPGHSEGPTAVPPRAG